MQNKDVNFDKLTHQQLEHIKSMALQRYGEITLSYYNKEVFNVQCFVYAFLCFLNANGYEIKKKEAKNEQ